MPPLRLPTLAITLLSLALNLAILGTAARTLSVFNSEKTTNAYFLPIWNQHFDTRELGMLIGTSAVIFVLNLVGAVVGGKALVGVATSSLTVLLSLMAIIFSAVLNAQSSRDTLQTWTCQWRNINDSPRQFNTLCNETRFAFYTTIPSFLLQLLLLSLALYSLFSARPTGAVRFDEEKAHELGSVRQQSFDTRLGTPRSVNDSVRAAKA